MIRWANIIIGVLIVEDNETMVNLERKILEMEGYEVEIARGGLVALQKIKESAYDIHLRL